MGHLSSCSGSELAMSSLGVAFKLPRMMTLFQGAAPKDRLHRAKVALAVMKS